MSVSNQNNTPTQSQKQAIALFSQYQGKEKLQTSILHPEDPLVLAFPEKIEVIAEEEYAQATGIPLFLRAVQNGKAHPLVPALNLEYTSPKRIAIYSKFLLSGQPISLEVFEVSGKVDLDGEEIGVLVEKYRH